MGSRVPFAYPRFNHTQPGDRVAALSRYDGVYDSLFNALTKILVVSPLASHRICCPLQVFAIANNGEAQLPAAAVGSLISSAATAVNTEAVVGPYAPAWFASPRPVLGLGGVSSRSNRFPNRLKRSSEAGGGDTGSGNNGDDGGNSGGSGNGGSGKGDGESSGDDDEEFLNLQEAEELAAAKGVELPEDFVTAARDGGLRKSVLQQYVTIASGGFVTSFLARTVPAFRDRLIADKLYFFKILAEVTIDSACATVAELRKRGDEFWDEFEFYLSDLVVGLVLDVVLVTLLAPVAIPGRKKVIPATGIRRWASQLPSAVFEKSSAGRRYTLSDRLGCYVARAMEYSLAGMACGIVGQAVASGMMVAKRQYLGSKEGEVAVPPVLETGLVWGAFMALSANTRYQIVAGIERVVDETIARKVPGIAYLTTTIIRFGNNIIGGEQFIDMARWAGVQ